MSNNEPTSEVSSTTAAVEVAEATSPTPEIPVLAGNPINPISRLIAMLLLKGVINVEVCAIPNVNGSFSAAAVVKIIDPLVDNISGSSAADAVTQLTSTIYGRARVWLDEEELSDLNVPVTFDDEGFSAPESEESVDEDSPLTEVHNALLNQKEFVALVDSEEEIVEDSDNLDVAVAIELLCTMLKSPECRDIETLSARKIVERVQAFEETYELISSKDLELDVSDDDEMYSIYFSALKNNVVTHAMHCIGVGVSHATATTGSKGKKLTLFTIKNLNRDHAPTIENEDGDIDAIR